MRLQLQTHARKVAHDEIHWSPILSGSHQIQRLLQAYSDAATSTSSSSPRHHTTLHVTAPCPSNPGSASAGHDQSERTVPRWRSSPRARERSWPSDQTGRNTLTTDPDRPPSASRNIPDGCRSINKTPRPGYLIFFRPPLPRAATLPHRFEACGASEAAAGQVCLEPFPLFPIFGGFPDSRRRRYRVSRGRADFACFVFD